MGETIVFPAGLADLSAYGFPKPPAWLEGELREAMLEIDRLREGTAELLLQVGEVEAVLTMLRVLF